MFITDHLNWSQHSVPDVSSVFNTAVCSWIICTYINGSLFGSAVRGHYLISRSCVLLLCRLCIPHLFVYWMDWRSHVCSHFNQWRGSGAHFTHEQRCGFQFCRGRSYTVFAMFRPATRVSCWQKHKNAHLNRQPRTFSNLLSSPLDSFLNYLTST